jgi:hypothetical protein
MSVRPLKLWKTQFFKNTTDQCGAMNRAMDDANQQSGMLVIHSHTQKYGRVWGYTDPDQFLRLISENRGLHEVLVGYPKKMYFDVDKKNDDESMTPVEFLNQTKEHIRSVFPDAQMAVSGSFTETKWYLHLTLSNYQIANEDELEVAKRIVKHMCATMDPAFDCKVYTKNRNMKCVNQSKRDGRIQGVIENDDLKAHCIMCFFDPGIVSISTLPVAVAQVAAMVPVVSRSPRISSGPLDLAMLPV